MARRLTVVVSQGQSKNPQKRTLEEDIITSLMLEPGIDVTVIPHLYDLTPEGTGMLALQGIGGDVVLMSWLYPRAAHWTLDRHAIRGKLGATEIEPEDDDDEEAGDSLEADDKERVLDVRNDIPNRSIYHLNLSWHASAETYVTEVKRIHQERSVPIVGLMDWVGGTPQPEQLERFQNPTNDTSVGAVAPPSPLEPQRIEEAGGRRWYPVIDFSRCTNCMECIDFCLFGVYGVDGAETILVEQPDNCRKGCPACSRVCPENAIIFPQHKSPAIAGAETGNEGLKIDLSQLFGAPDSLDIAAKERDEQLVAAGREAVGTTVGMPKRQSQPSERDELDDLIDSLDDLDV